MLITSPAGESYRTIFRYFLPEFVTALILSSVLVCVDAAFIAHLKSTSLYAMQGVLGTWLHFLIKVTEGLSVGTVIVCGKLNGQGKLDSVGKALVSALFVTLGMGIFVASLLYFFAPSICAMYGVSEKMTSAGIDFLRLRAVGVLCTFIYFAAIGFLRSIKNTFVPMVTFIIGGITFIFFDYVLVFGVWGFPELRLQGSAMAALIQYTVMSFCALCYIFYSEETRKYVVHVTRSINKYYVWEILQTSWPVMIDKATLALAKMWLSVRIAPMGKIALASFTAIKDMEQLAFVPAIACAQVITFLVSNDFGKKNWDGIYSNITKIVLIAATMVAAILGIFSFWPSVVLTYFDTKGAFGFFVGQAFPILSILVFCDLLQLIFAGALRGAGDVRTVMMVRLVTCTCFFAPVAYVLSILPIDNLLIKFILIYSSFYVSNGIMSLLYLYRLQGEAWKK